ncbi:MAG: PAS domain-containing sensor histidine kinase [Arcobacteraceae bacterium]|nr:PAS domain-containing sensor histidine kinase [Arcobacteraceae bacterium]
MDKYFYKNSLYATVTYLIISIVTIIMSLHASYAYITTKENITQDMEKNTNQTIIALQKNIANFIETYSINEYNILIQNELEKRGMFAIVVEDYKMGEIVGEQSYISGKIKSIHGAIVDFEGRDKEQIKELENCFYSKNHMIYNHDKKIIGKITLYTSDTHLKNELFKIVKTSIFNLFILSFTLVITLIITLRFFILKPIVNITNSISKHDEYGLPKELIPARGPSEIAFLGDTMNSMVKTIKKSIEKEKLFKEEILNEKNKLKSIFENIPDLLWFKDSNGVYITCNKRFEDFFGATKEEIIGKTDYEFVDKELANFFRRNDQNALNSTTPISNFEEVTFANDHHKEYLHTIKSRIIDLNNNKIIGVLGIGRDITNIRDKELEIIKQKEEFETIFNTSKDGIAILDLNSNYLDFNDAYLEMTGFTREELLTKSSLDLTIQEDKERSKKSIEDVIKYGFVKNFEKSYLLKDNKIITINMSLALMPDKNRIIVSTKDVTANKLFESQAKLASMGEMIGNIAHQWRQPLSIISTLASSIEFKQDYGNLKEGEIASSMSQIVLETQYLSKTIDDFRNFIKDNDIQSTINITTLFEKTLSIVGPSLKNNYIEIIKQIDSTIEIKCYENQLMQAFINIINNAKDAIIVNENIDSKYLFIEVNKIDGKCYIVIKDNGGGIDQKIIDRIFEPYFTTKHQSQGTGLGLSLTNKIITEMHHGTITASNSTFFYENKEYTGACFTIIL